MIFLVYGIVRAGGTGMEPLPLGMMESQVFLISDRGLAVVVSHVPEGYSAPEIADLMAYAAVIQKLSQRCTILPFRFGCFLESQEQVLELLHRRLQIFELALTEVEGCVEMSLRSLLEEEDPVNRKGQKEPALPASGGLAYLASRKAYYANKDQIKNVISTRTQDLQGAFTGLFVKSLVEDSSNDQGRLMAIHFLIPRENIERFRLVFERIQNQGTNKVLLTGPWPPFNFFNHNPRELTHEST